MRIVCSIGRLWPGFSQAWLQGDLAGVGVALGFAAALNTALLAMLVWPEWPVRGLPSGANAAAAWLVVLGLWIGGWRLGRTAACAGGLQSVPDADLDLDALFLGAQREYLKGHWIEAELNISRLLDKSPRDVEARLLLASIQRRTRRWNEARQTLQSLQEDERAVGWTIEVEIELRLIVESEEEARLARAA